jgi:hypothetical protein
LVDSHVSSPIQLFFFLFFFFWKLKIHGEMYI